jgi:phosphoribosylaminoimidazolecarboxamide formyltransferase/IMP cyclohydrolase
MVRAAAKNRHHVVVLTDPDQYEEFLLEYDKGQGQVPGEFGEKCGAVAFRKLAAYDGAIATWLNNGQFESLALEKVRDLRYGENPHQSAALYSRAGSVAEGLIASDKLSGKQLSYNNLLDADGSLSLLGEFEETACIIIKHVTPCGVGVGATVFEAVTTALKTDPVSAFGGIVAINRPLDKAAAEVLSEIFLEIILAPSFTVEARDVLAKKKALRLISFDWPSLRSRGAAKEIRHVWGGYLMQDADRGFPEWSDAKVVTKRAPTSDELKALELGWKVCKHVRSNAIVFSSAAGTLGIGAGQMSRVDSARFAIFKSQAVSLSLKNSVCASDAFFPFRDGLDLIADAGATAVVQPGGSVRDEEVIAAANEHNIAMLYTGRRHFKH